MAEQRSIIINTVDQGGNKKQKSITDINPAASGGQMYDFANALIGLTDSTLVTANVIDKTELGGTKQQLTLAVTKSAGGDGTTVSYAALKAEEGDYVEIEYKVGNTALTRDQMKLAGVPYVKSCTAPLTIEIYYSYNGTINAYSLFLTPDDALIETEGSYGPDANTAYNMDGSGEIVVVIPDTDTYYGGTFTITVTA